MNFSTEEMVDMIFIIGESYRNCLLASRIYKERYPDRRQPQVSSFEHLLERFTTTGNVKYAAAKQEKTVVNEDNETMVLAAVADNPHVSQRTISTNLSISCRSVRRILKKHQYHPYKVQLHQELQPADYEMRENFCQIMQNKLEREPDVYNCILFTDESTFHNNGFVSGHNFHYYSDVNPHLVTETHRQNRWSLNVWGGLIGTYIIGPFFFDGNLTGQIFYNFLENNLNELLDDVPLLIRQNMWIQLDGAPAHFSVNVRELLNVRFPERWIGRGAPIGWPARSPDLTPLDFFLWGYVKTLVYKEPPTTPDDMKMRIRQAFRQITPQMLTRVQTSFRKRIYLCLRNQGAHIEQLL
jgi:Transposase.